MGEYFRECRFSVRFDRSWPANTAANNSIHYCVKNVRIRSFSGPYFPTFELNTDQKNSEQGHFSRSELFYIGSCSRPIFHFCSKNYCSVPKYQNDLHINT